jgi:hypothetical protein
VLAGQDFTGILRLQVRVDAVTRKGNVAFQLGEPAEELLPGALLPTLRVLRHFHAPNRLELQIGGTRALQQPTLLPQVEPVTDAFLALVEDLEQVQAASRYTATEIRHRKLRAGEGRVLPRGGARCPGRARMSSS